MTDRVFSSWRLPLSGCGFAPQPNPLRDKREIAFVLPEQMPIRLAVYDALGREVAVLAEGVWEAGHHTTSINGRQLAPGVYLTQLQVNGSQVFAQRLTVAR
ncbi:MAG: hypothetical protein Rubg2KO_14110 [Rubricoccaceae bacterium]